MRCTGYGVRWANSLLTRSWFMVGNTKRTECMPVTDFVSGDNYTAAPPFIMVVVVVEVDVVVSVMRNPAALTTKARVSLSTSSHLV